MSKLIILTFISFIQIALINSQETYDEKNYNKKSSTIWTTQALLDYTLKHHGKDKYFICDPLGYISEDEKEVIYYRIEAIYNKLNITTVFFVLDKISLEGLNITDEEEDEDDDIVYASNITKDNNTADINETMEKNEEKRQREFKIYIAEIKKKLFNRKIFAEKESKSLVGIFTVEDIGKYLYVGKDYSDLVNHDEIKYLMEGEDYLIEQKNLYIAVDNLFSNFLYRYSPSKLDKFNKFMGFMGEMLGLGAIIFSYYLMNRKKEEQPVQRKAPKKEEKKNDGKNDKKEEAKKDEKKDDIKSKEKEKQD